MPRPITSQAARKTGRLWARPSRASPAASSSELAVKHRPPAVAGDGAPDPGEIIPAARSPSERPPTTAVSDQPVSWAIGPANTPSR
jgi:hypothetical protein